MKLSDIKNVTVAGCGVQGSQIASMCAYKGFDTKVWVRSEGSIDRAKPRMENTRTQIVEAIEAWLEDPAQYCRGLSDDPNATMEERERLREHAQSVLGGAIPLTCDWDEAFGDADIIIEAISENPDEKTAFYQELAKHVKPTAIIVSDSSSLPPSMFKDATGHPDRFLTMHFVNQIWKNNPVEVMGTSETDPEVEAVTNEFTKAIGMHPLKLKKENPGYISFNLVTPWFISALAMVEDGVADPETIDKCWELVTGADPGQTPFRKIDKISATTLLKAISLNPRAKEEGSPESKAVKILQRYVDEGKTGIAVGEGFYKY